MGCHHPQEGFCKRKLPVSNDKVTKVWGCLQRTAKEEQVFGSFHSQKSPEIVMQMFFPSLEFHEPGSQERPMKSTDWTCTYKTTEPT